MILAMVLAAIQADGKELADLTKEQMDEILRLGHRRYPLGCAPVQSSQAWGVAEMSAKYVLVGHRPVIEPDLLKWADDFEKTNRRVAMDTIGEVRVSTVFLGIDHQFGNGPPLLFETLIFGGPLDGSMLRCSTWEEAEDGHKEAVAKAKGA